MKKLFFTLIISILSALMVQAQIHFKLAYQVGVPLGQMNHNIHKNAQGLAAEVGLHLAHTPLTIGWHWGSANYGIQNTTELNVFAQGAQSKVNVDVKNYFIQSHFFVNYEFRQKKFFRPYASLGVGRSRFNTFMTIGAETSTIDCPKPLETGFPLKDKVMYAIVGGGIKLELAPLLNMKQGVSFCLDLQAQYTLGGKIDYLTVRQDATPPPNSEAVNVKFASQAKPNVIHQYYAGNRYTSPMHLLVFQIGFSYVSNFGTYD